MPNKWLISITLGPDDLKPYLHQRGPESCRLSSYLPSCESLGLLKLPNTKVEVFREMSVATTATFVRETSPWLLSSVASNTRRDLPNTSFKQDSSTAGSWQPSWSNRMIHLAKTRQPVKACVNHLARIRHPTKACENCASFVCDWRLKTFLARCSKSSEQARKSHWRVPRINPMRPPGMLVSY